MVAIDANVLVRLLTADDVAQHRVALKLFSSNEIYIPDSVVLETEWVLRAAYRLSSIEICDTFKTVFGLENVTLSNGQLVAQAVAWHEAGLDFADAFHLAQSQDCESLKTFDSDFIKRARNLSHCAVEKPA